LKEILYHQVKHPYLKELAAASQEVAHMVIRDNGEAVYVNKVEGNRTIRMYSQIGHRVALHSTAVGKAMLAFLPPIDKMAVIDSFMHGTKNVLRENARWHKLYPGREILIVHTSRPELDIEERKGKKGR